ncbi:Ig-like domain-containing protein [Thermostichus vulcanus]|uniref:Ig-like domain-containing protein n=1 Tax=Thermostichus vulcanus str. 'Rupite' TaxID=2813851 RepID=A0ABT0C834_THEVL|nr:Ig-like domain-containing protein [Thermostichus vulcanus]MCJ2541944.1 Ig-like domain-containing protein [Thermostichus vulcanus str. 'Rupite']
MILAGCSDDSSSSTVPLPPPPPPAPPPAPPAPPAPPPTPTPQNLLLSVVVTRTSSGGSGLGETTGLLPGGTVTGVSIDTSFRFRFGTSVNAAPFASSFTIRASSGATVSTTCEFNFDSTEVVCTPNSPLVNDQTYTLTISNVPDLFADGRPLFPSPQTFTFTTGATAVGPGPISFLASQFAAVTPNGQIFSNPVVIPVGYGIRRTSPAENVPVGVRTDYRALLSFPIPSSIPANAVVQSARLTLVQLPSNDSVSLPGFGDTGLGFFFLDPTPHNIPANNVVFQEVTLGAPNNVVSSDFFAPASTPSFIALSINGNVLGGDISAGPRVADVAPGVQRSVSGSRFYQIRLQCAREVFNNQATPSLLSVGTISQSFSFNLPTQNVQFEAVGNATFAQTLITRDNGGEVITNAATVNATFGLQVNPNTVTVVVSGSTFVGTINPSSSIVTFSASNAVPPAALAILFPGNSISVTTQPVVVTGATSQSQVNAFGQFNPIFLGNLAATIDLFSTVSLGTASASSVVANAGGANFEVSQGSNGVCRAEFDKDPGTGTAPITTARGPRLDVTFTIPR